MAPLSSIQRAKTSPKSSSATIGTTVARSSLRTVLVFFGCTATQLTVAEAPTASSTHHNSVPVEAPFQTAWSVTVESLPAVDCVDADGDGFQDAWSCPGLSPEVADCDDTDPSVTPSTERWVPPGPFLMGSESDHAGLDEGPIRVVTLSGYCLDVYEDPREGWAWSAANAFCEEQDKSLPTEAMWEKAARGGCELGNDPTACDDDDLRPWPWGWTVPNCSQANSFDTVAGKRCQGRVVAPGSFPAGAGPYGHQDLVGNLWEWTADWYEAGAYLSAPTVDPSGPSKGAERSLRGGCWNSFVTNTRVSNRFPPLMANEALGVRCARTRTSPQTTPMGRGVQEGRLDWERSDRDDLVELSGEAPNIDGELIVTVFDEAGQRWMGHSPVAEFKQFGGGDWSLSVPAGTYVVEFMAVGPGGHHAARVTVTADQDGRVDVPLTTQAGVGSPGHPPAPPRRAPTPPG